MSDEPGAAAEDGVSDSVPALAGSTRSDGNGGGYIGGLGGVVVGVAIVALCWFLGQREAFTTAIIIWFSGFVLALFLGIFGKWYLVGGGLAIGLLSMVVLLAVACFAAFQPDYLGIDKVAEGKLAPTGAKLVETTKSGADFYSTTASVHRRYADDEDADVVFAFYRAELSRRGWRLTYERKTEARWQRDGVSLSVEVVSASKTMPKGFEVVVLTTKSD